MTEPRDSKRQTVEHDLPELTSEERSLADLLKHAYAPGSLSPELNQILIDAALEDPLRAPTADELAESERFRRALEGGEDHPDLQLVRELTAAHLRVDGRAPVDRAADRALQRALPELAIEPPRSGHKPTGKLITLSFGVISGLAAAAAVALLLSPTREPNVAVQQGESLLKAPQLSQSRSTQALFSEKFEPHTTTSRIDRIARVRGRELRHNRFRQWGIE